LDTLEKIVATEMCCFFAKLVATAWTSIDMPHNVFPGRLTSQIRRLLAPTISELHGPYMWCALKTRIAQTRLATLEEDNLGTNCRFFKGRYATCVINFLFSRANKLIAYEGHLTEIVFKIYAFFFVYVLKLQSF
jgi:hypothetical protein